MFSAAVLIAAFSCANTGFYGTVRCLYGLSVEGLAPKMFSRLDKKGSPKSAVLFTLAAMWLVLMLGMFAGGGVLYESLLSVSGFTGTLAWIGIIASQICFRRRLRQNGYIPEQCLRAAVPERKRWVPAFALIAQLVCLMMLAFGEGQQMVFLIAIQDIAELFVLGAVGMGATDYLLNLAYELLPVSTVVMLHFLYPAIVLVISCGVFHQGISVLSAGAVVLSIFGLILVGGLQGGVSLQGVIFALGSALSYAFFVTANQHGQVNRLPLMVKLFYMSLITMIIYLMKTGFSRHFSLPPDFKTGAIAIGVVGLGSLLAFYLITAGIKQIGARKASFLNMLEPVAGVVLSVLIYRESFPLRSLIGCLCIVGSVLFIAFDSRESTD